MSTVPWWAPLVSAAVAAVVVGGFSLAATALAGRSQRRALLHTDRIAAYQSFRHTFFDVLSASTNLADRWHARSAAFKRLEADRSSDGREFDSAQAAFDDSVRVLIENDRLLQFALADLEMVASGPVRRAAMAMRTLADEIRRKDMEVGSGQTEEDFVKWREVNDKRRELQALEKNLVAAIQFEFAVDSL